MSRPAGWLAGFFFETPIILGWEQLFFMDYSLFHSAGRWNMSQQGEIGQILRLTPV